MTDRPRWFQTTAIDYPNSRPHIGTAFEKLGADVQARYRRMEGYDVYFLMGNDENTVKVSKRAAELASEELIKEIFVFGTPEEIKARLDEFVAGGITTAVLTPIASPDQLPELIDALARR